MAVTEPLPSRLRVFYQFTRPFFIRQDVSWPAVCPSSFSPGLLAGEFCRPFLPLPRGFAPASKGVLPGKPPRPRRISRLSLQRSSRQRPDVHPPPYRWGTPGFVQPFSLFLRLPFLSGDATGSVPIGRAWGAEGGWLSFSCPALPPWAESRPSRIAVPRQKPRFPEGRTGAAHRRGFRSNPCCLAREEGEAGSLRSGPRPPSWPERNGARSSAALCIFPRAKPTMNPSGAVGSRPGPPGSSGGAARPHAPGRASSPGSTHRGRGRIRRVSPPTATPVLTLPRPRHRPPRRAQRLYDVTAHPRSRTAAL